MIKKNITKKGSTVLELLFYVSFFAILSLVVINAIIIMAKSFRETSIQSELVQSGAVMERMSREIRQANSISSISATDLLISTGTNSTKEFLFSDSNIQFLEDGVLTGNLNTPNIIISGLTFTQINTIKGQAVKIFFTVKSSNDILNRTFDFYDTVVLRGSY